MPITVIIPTKNCRDMLVRCLKSVNEQTYRDFEVIVADNESTDGTPEAAEKLGATVLPIQGKGDNRVFQKNIAAKKAKHDNILIIDSDMVLTPTVLEELSGVKEDCAFIPEKSFGRTFWSKTREFGRSMHERDVKLNAARYFKKKLFFSVGGYDENLIVMEDVDLTNRLKKKGATFKKISSLIYHDEGDLTLSKAIRKKFNYGRTLNRYIKKNRKIAKSHTTLFRSVYFKEPTHLLRHPILTVGFFFMRICEFAAAAISYKLTTWGFLKDTFGKRRILIVFGHAIGDNIMLTPVIRQLRKDNPNAFIAIAGLRYLPIRDLWKNNPHIDKYVDLDFDYNPRIWNPVYFYLKDLPLIKREIRRYQEKFDIFETYIIRTRGLIKPFEHKTQVIANELGISMDDMSTELYIDNGAEKEAADFLASHGVKGTDTVIGIHRTAGDYLKKSWDYQETHKFVDAIQEKYKAKIIVFNSRTSYQEEEKYEHQHLQGRDIIPIPLKPQMSILASAALIRRCALFVGTDSGPGHIAGAVGTPLISLFIATDPKRYSVPGAVTLTGRVTASRVLKAVERILGH